VQRGLTLRARVDDKPTLAERNPFVRFGVAIIAWLASLVLFAEADASGFKIIYSFKASGFPHRDTTTKEGPTGPGRDRGGLSWFDCSPTC
jgi:hypothetical protein